MSSSESSYINFYDENSLRNYISSKATFKKIAFQTWFLKVPKTLYSEVLRKLKTSEGLEVIQILAGCLDGELELLEAINVGHHKVSEISMLLSKWDEREKSLALGRTLSNFKAMKKLCILTDEFNDAYLHYVETVFLELKRSNLEIIDLSKLWITHEDGLKALLRQPKLKQLRLRRLKLSPELELRFLKLIKSGYVEGVELLGYQIGLKNIFMVSNSLSSPIVRMCDISVEAGDEREVLLVSRLSGLFCINSMNIKFTGPGARLAIIRLIEGGVSPANIYGPEADSIMRVLSRAYFARK